MACVSSKSKLELGEVLVAGELGVDLGTGFVGIVMVYGLLTAVRCTTMWSQVVAVGTGGVHTCFGCSGGLVKGI